MWVGRDGRPKGYLVGSWFHNFQNFIKQCGGRFVHVREGEGEGVGGRGHSDFLN